MEKDPNFYLRKIDRLLNQLLNIAKELNALSTQKISKQELSTLQQDQGTLLKAIRDTDKEAREHRDPHGEVDAALEQRVQKKLLLFQELNTQYIRNLSDTSTVIDFHPE